MVRRRLSLLCIIVLVAVVGSECMLRLCGHWCLRPYYEGLSNGSITGRAMILCLGESSTAGLWCNFEDSYPKQLERLLNRHFETDRYVAIIPPHVGQNTSQLANRIEQYIQLYHPQLIILMAGANNEWSFGESNVARFLRGTSLEQWQLKLIIFLSNFRTYKLLRYVSQGFMHRSESDTSRRLYFEMLGHPALSDFPPRRAIYELAQRHRDAIVEAWRYDMRQIISTALAHSVPVLLMTYHINPTFLTPEEFMNMAAEYNVPLVALSKTRC